MENLQNASRKLFPYEHTLHTLCDTTTLVNIIMYEGRGVLYTIAQPFKQTFGGEDPR